MAKSRKKRQEKQQPGQQYDTTFKDWMRQQARDVVPQLLPGYTYEGTLDVNIIRPTMRVDKVFKVRSQDEDCIANFEYESGSDPYIVSRLLAYNAVLYHDYQLPVISMIVYPFKTTMAESPLRVRNGKNHILTFDFLRLPLFEEDAEYYVRERIMCMYPVLPTMRNANFDLLKQAMGELVALFREDEVTLSQQFVWMELLLQRTETIPLSEKRKIQEQFSMYDPLWENHPKVKKIRAESKAEGLAKGEAEGLAKGKAEGRVEGEVYASQRMFVNIVKARFPALAELAQQEALRVADPGALDLLAQKIVTAPDENIARWLLSPPAA